MSVVLVPDVIDHTREITPVQCRSVITTGPATSPGDAAIGPQRGYALGLPDKVTESCVGSETDEQVNVVSQHGAGEDPNLGLLASARDATSDIIDSFGIQTPHTLPSVPRDVGVKLVCVVSGHPISILSSRSHLTRIQKSQTVSKGLPTPGASPGLMRTGIRRARVLPTPGASPGLMSTGIRRARVLRTPARKPGVDEDRNSPSSGLTDPGSQARGRRAEELRLGSSALLTPRASRGEHASSD